MKVYVTTGRLHASRAELVAYHLFAAGHEATHAWWRNPDVVPLRAAEAAIAGVRSADIVVAILRGDRETHAAIGAALALGKPVLAWDETGMAWIHEPATIYAHPLLVQRSGDLSEPVLMAALVDQVSVVVQEHRAGRLGRSAYGHAHALANRIAGRADG